MSGLTLPRLGAAWGTISGAAVVAACCLTLAVAAVAVDPSPASIGFGLWLALLAGVVVGLTAFIEVSVR